MTKTNMKRNNSSIGSISIRNDSSDHNDDENLRKKLKVDASAENGAKTTTHQNKSPDTERSYGKISDVVILHDHDVLCGRGGGTNNHAGNEFFRSLVNSKKREYLNTTKRNKPRISESIVMTIRNKNPPGRFLTKNTRTNLWDDIGDQKAREKTSQALREGAPLIRRTILDEEAKCAMNNQQRNVSKAGEMLAHDSEALLLKHQSLLPASCERGRKKTMNGQPDLSDILESLPLKHEQSLDHHLMMKSLSKNSNTNNIQDETSHSNRLLHQYVSSLYSQNHMPNPLSSFSSLNQSKLIASLLPDSSSYTQGNGSTIGKPVFNARIPPNLHSLSLLNSLSPKIQFGTLATPPSPKMISLTTLQLQQQQQHESMLLKKSSIYNHSTSGYLAGDDKYQKVKNNESEDEVKSDTALNKRNRSRKDHFESNNLDSKESSTYRNHNRLPINGFTRKVIEPSSSSTDDSNVSEKESSKNNKTQLTNISESTPDNSDETSESDPLTFLSDVCGQLKKLKRTGWVRHNIPFPESDADHMHRCAMCAMMLTQPPNPLDEYDSEPNKRFHPSKISPNHVVKMALVHDLCEALAGDVTPFCDPKLVKNKHEKEKVSMEEIRQIVGDPLGKELLDLWQEYESQQTVESIYCKDIDKFEMVMQAYEYEKDHLINTKNSDSNNEGGPDFDNQVLYEPMRTFFITTNNVMKTPIFRRLDKGIREKRELMLKSKGWEVSKEERQSYEASK